MVSERSDLECKTTEKVFEEVTHKDSTRQIERVKLKNGSLASSLQSDRVIKKRQRGRRSKADTSSREGAATSFMTRYPKRSPYPLRKRTASGEKQIEESHLREGLGR
ncbi:hypothetical protein TNCV_4017011 [Trichonephila clavipes]|nr:hypothetical protein TNCV_4017011 [Trichonephila clavipes]